MGAGEKGEGVCMRLGWCGSLWSSDALVMTAAPMLAPPTTPVGTSCGFCTVPACPALRHLLLRFAPRGSTLWLSCGLHSALAPGAFFLWQDLPILVPPNFGV